MIQKGTIRYLISQKIRDAQCLLKGGRHKAAVYIMGYALELALKWRICVTWDFRQGFPENRSELNAYLAVISTGGYRIRIPTNIGEIKHHKLNVLLQYSGAELKIRSTYGEAWSLLLSWNPESRYIRDRIPKDKANRFFKTAKVIIFAELL